MRIPCPFCGSRDSREFVYRGDAAPARPTDGGLGADGEPMFDYVYLRDNPIGELEEFWYHAQGCRNWLRVVRDTRSHMISAAVLGAGHATGGQA
ncbi:sarcosine oxidase delta subunit heterotetrameric [Novosphingobium nitrogenifigens DSM 19370]|uniref:Sarcosine oxidase delta subunit heterotetrameric n=1 Tax=Novosphingobium nitrogenifigens DSM 19370 TaxID=983920 RepID=F1ZCT8_9SPHN|nr:sarcosine oxidase subunit delta [Novosphingobium nitrogenifigens]EGD57575.1 sarcosine oxidase delta subunit heterotetrameric [Novosphingobium nitrogenifigens DSM 19370]